jgi:nitroreductase/FMN reductase [NAD(P)H]
VVRNHVEARRDAKLPPGVFPVAGLCVGYPAARLDEHAAPDRGDRAHRPLRRCGPARGSRPTTPGEARHAAENQRFVERFGYSAPYGWSEDKARQYSVPERHNFGPFIRGHGFGLI